MVTFGGVLVQHSWTFYVELVEDGGSVPTLHHSRLDNFTFQHSPSSWRVDIKNSQLVKKCVKWDLTQSFSEYVRDLIFT